MVYQRSHWGHAPIDMGYGDILKNVLEGYKASYTPQLMQNQLAQEEHGIEAQRLANVFQQAKEPYAQQMAAIDPQTEQAKLQLLLAQAAHQRRQAASPYSDMGKTIEDYKNIAQHYDPALAEELFTRYLQDKSTNKPHLTEAQQFLQQLQDPNIPEETKDIISQLAGVQLPGSTDKITSYPKGVQSMLIKQNQEYLNKAVSAKKVIRTIDELEKITNAHPDLANYFSAALEGRENPTMLDQLKRKYLGNEKALTAIQTFDKLSNELILDMTSSIGNRATDNLRETIRRSKPSSRNTLQANKNIYKNLKEQFSPIAETEKNILKAKEKNKVYHPRESSFGESSDYTDEQIEATARRWGKTPEEVRRYLANKKGGK